MNVLSCVYNELQYLYQRFKTTIKSSTEVNYFAYQWICYDVVISMGGIFLKKALYVA